ncbi:MAG: hypothetical protein GOMPHAMPRED_002952 [Gomphillus americanus]|uniref:Uncharacterized protein n=1 Tax=Gomphillus americanus TaxID=1940652 RepID=A0A8H3EDF5_9LECA|nr:MAG: hypothetical protein GOMPHAMPRED_002952 [Gomphillus americanus]
MATTDSKALFSVPIGSAGSVVCSQPLPKVYFLVFTSPPDNRLTPEFCKAMVTALDIVEYMLPKGVVVTTSGIPKFYSNGLDLESAINTPGFWKDSLYTLWRRLLTYPMPLVALINGHAFAGGLMTAMMHDYRIMNPHKGYLCLNEVEFGAPLRPPMASIFRDKLPRPDTFRTILLEAKRFNALEALKEGVIDGLGGPEETIKFIAEMGLTAKAESGVYGKLKEEMWRQTVRLLEQGGAVEEEDASSRINAAALYDEAALKRVKEWQSHSRSLSKL